MAQVFEPAPSFLWESDKDLIGIVLSYLFLRDATLVDGTPCNKDVSQDEGDEQTDPCHGAERKLTATSIGDGE